MQKRIIEVVDRLMEVRQCISAEAEAIPAVLESRNADAVQGMQRNLTDAVNRLRDIDKQLMAALPDISPITPPDTCRNRVSIPASWGRINLLHANVRAALDILMTLLKHADILDDTENPKSLAALARSAWQESVEVQELFGNQYSVINKALELHGSPLRLFDAGVSHEG